MEIAKIIVEYVKALAWPVIVLFVVLRFRSSIHAILTQLATKLTSAESVKFGVFGHELEIRTSAMIPTPETNEKISEKHIALTYTCFRAARHDETFKERVYQFEVVVACSGDVLDRIEYVEYFLPPAWPPSSSPKRVYDKQSRFKLKELTWADLIVKADIHFKTQPEVLSLSCFVPLTKVGARI